MLTKIVHIAKRFLNNRGRNLTRKWATNRTRTRLAQLPAEQGITITPEQERQALEYWGRYIKIDPAFPRFYTKATGQFDPRYIPDDVHIVFADKFFNDWARARYIDNKTLYPVLFASLRQPTTIAMRRAKFWYDSEGNIISPDKLRELLMQHENFFVKAAENSYGGAGVKYVATPDNHTVEEILNTGGGDIVIQKGISQCAEIASLNPSSINTVRIMTLLRKDGSVKICSAILRMGVDNSKVDNASSGGIISGIQPDGRLKSMAYNRQGVAVPHAHPTSGTPFESVVIPGFADIIELVKKEAIKMPHFRLVSWDIAVEADGKPTLIEANLCDGGIVTHQLANGPIFGDETEEILNEIFGK